jgi:hypothetical protein
LNALHRAFRFRSSHFSQHCHKCPAWDSGQTRSFVYDSLKRLTSATNPETSANGVQSGTISYAYDANSNLTQKTDARGVISSFGNINAGACDNCPMDLGNCSAKHREAPVGQQFRIDDHPE